MKKRIKKIALIATAFMFVGQSLAAADPAYYPEGPQRNVALSSVTSGGWTLCYSGLMREDIVSKESISNACTGDYVLYSGRATGSNTLLLLAAAEASTVFTVTNINQTTLGNGTYWYFNDRSLGFSPNGTITQNTADTNSETDPLRFSLHTLPAQVIGGWRIGDLLGLNGSVDYEKLIYTSNGATPVSMPLTQVAPITASVDKNIMTCSAGTYKVGMSEVAVSSVRYHLYVNNELMSTVVYDKGSNIPDAMKTALPNKVSALVSAKDALFDLSGMSSYSAHCVVEAYGYGSATSSFSNSYQDAAFIAAANAKAKAWEDQRASATAANFTQQAREMRKRIAAKSGN